MAESELVIKITGKQAEQSARSLGKVLDRLSKSGDKVQNSIDNVNKNTNQMSRSAKVATSSFRMLTGAVAGLSLTAFAKSVFDTTASFQSMKLQLKTLLGDMDSAEGAFKSLVAFSDKTPYSLEQSVKAFQKLAALGLKPSEAALTSYGNTASAMGKDLMQMIEAVADASTGEFERLKEFGIKASKQGDEVSFTFQGVTKTVKNSSEEIQKYLMGIGETNFAGAMDDQMAGLQGQLTNVQSEFAKLKAALGRGLEDSSFLMTIADWIKSIREALPAIISFFRNMGAQAAYIFSRIGMSWDRTIIGFKKGVLGWEYFFRLILAKIQGFFNDSTNWMIEKAGAITGLFSKDMEKGFQKLLTIRKANKTEEEKLRDEMLAQEDSFQRQLDYIAEQERMGGAILMNLEQQFEKDKQIAEAEQSKAESIDKYANMLSKAASAQDKLAEASKKTADSTKNQASETETMWQKMNRLTAEDGQTRSILTGEVIKPVTKEEEAARLKKYNRMTSGDMSDYKAMGGEAPATMDLSAGKGGGTFSPFSSMAAKGKEAVDAVVAGAKQAIEGAKDQIVANVKLGFEEELITQQFNVVREKLQSLANEPIYQKVVVQTVGGPGVPSDAVDQTSEKFGGRES
jgi:hypothetical protein